MMSDLKELRSYNFEIRAEDLPDDGNGKISGRAIVFNEVYDNGWFDEVIEPGALDNTDMKDVCLLVNHDRSMIPLARSRNNNANSTLQLFVDGSGLNVSSNIDIKGNGTAAELFSATKRGDVDGMSFMFMVSGERWEDLESDHPKRFITDIKKIFEVSAVTWPAYKSTSFEARAAEAGTLESAKSTLESARAAARANEMTRKKAELRDRLKTIKEMH